MFTVCASVRQLPDKQGLLQDVPCQCCSDAYTDAAALVDVCCNAPEMSQATGCKLGFGLGEAIDDALAS